MLTNTLLFTLIMADISARAELSVKELVDVATEVANQPEFKDNTEIKPLIAELSKESALVHARKIAYKMKLKEEV